MADVTENSLRAAVKALTDVIAPTMDKADPLAHEQLRLVVEYLEFTRSRLPFLYDRDRFELSHHLGMAALLQKLDAPYSAATVDALATAIEAGSQAYACAGAPMTELKSASATLAAAIRILIRESSAFDETSRYQIEKRILDASNERIEFERSWFVPLGFDPSENEVPAVEAIVEKLVRNKTMQT